MALAKPEEPETATVSTARLTIKAPASKVYSQLTDVAQWKAWRAKGVQPESFVEGGLAPGDKFAYKAGPNRVDATVTQVQKPKVFIWTDRTLFGMVHAKHTVKLEQSGGPLGLGGRSTQVTLREELSGPLRWAVKGRALEDQNAAFLTELKKVCEA